MADTVSPPPGTARPDILVLDAGNLDSLMTQLAGNGPVVNRKGANLTAYSDLQAQVQALGSDITRIATYAAMRLYSGLAETVFIDGRTLPGDGAHGVFYYDAADITTADDDGTVLVGTAGRRWKRKYSPPVNIKWFGAKGDNASNDTQAYLAAIATEKSVYFPKGTYLVAPVAAPTSDDRISGAILSSGQMLFGDGQESHIEWNTAVAPTVQTFMMITSGSGIVVRDLRLSGGALAAQIKPSSDGAVDGVTFENLTIDNVGIGLGLGEQIALNPSGSKYAKNVTVRNCKFNTIGVHGIVTSNIYGFNIDDNSFSNIGYFAGSGGFCVDMSQGSRYGTVINNVSENSRYFCKTESSTVAPATAANCLSHHISIQNNKIRNMVPQGAAETEIAILCNNGASDISISNNMIDYPATGSAIFLSDTNPTATGPTSVEGNIISTAKNGITTFMKNAGLATQVSIRGNSISGVSYGVTVRHDNVDISGNNISCSQAAVYLPVACDDVSVFSNKLSSTTYGVLFTAATSSGIKISCNKFDTGAAYIYSEFAIKRLSVTSNHVKAVSGAYFTNVDGLLFSDNYVTTTGSASFPSALFSGVSNGAVTNNAFNTNSTNPNVSLTFSGTLLNLAVENNKSVNGVTVGAGTNVVSTNNAFTLAYVS